MRLDGLERCNITGYGYFQPSADACANLCLAISSCIGFSFWTTLFSSCCSFQQAPYYGVTDANNMDYYSKLLGECIITQSIFKQGFPSFSLASRRPPGNHVYLPLSVTSEWLLLGLVTLAGARFDKPPHCQSSMLTR